MNTKRYTAPTGKAVFQANGWNEQYTKPASINTANEILYALVILASIAFAAGLVYFIVSLF